MNIKTGIRNFLKDESGQTTTEYILILAVVVMVAVKFKDVFKGQLESAVTKLGGKVTDTINEIN